MKNVGIITLYDNNNYGNRLQNYALQEQLNKLGCNPETIVNNTKDKNKRKIKYQIKRVTIKKIIEKMSEKIFRNIEMKSKKDLVNIRKKMFNEFNNEYIKNSKYVIENNMNYAKKMNNYYDYYIIGSDQVWNPYTPAITETFFANFSDRKKNIAYAPSFGINSIPHYMVDLYIKGLKNIQYISVREKRGKEIIEHLINAKVQVLIDPTMLLTSTEWMKISKTPDKILNQKYILTCFLGRCSKKRKSIIKKIANKNNLKIITLNSIKDEQSYKTGPSEFIYYINNAEIILTDSFHVCAFAILFKKRFFVLKRNQEIESMSSRIETLLSKFNLTDRTIEDKDIENNFSENCDYSNLDKTLENERQKSIKFLKRALNIEENKSEE